MRNFIWAVIAGLVFAGCATQGYGPNTQAIIDQELNLTEADRARNEMYYKARYGALCENAGYPRDTGRYFDCLQQFYNKDLEQRIQSAMNADNSNAQFRSDVMWDRIQRDLQPNYNNYGHLPTGQQVQVCEYAGNLRVCR